MPANNPHRRDFLKTSAIAAGASAAGSFSLASAIASEEKKLPAGKADSCIFIWLGGGACHLDTWDPKKVSKGKTDPGSYYESIETAVKGVRVCEHLKQSAKLMERIVPVRSVHHDVIDEHAAATNRLHVGRPPTGTTIYPSLGSVMSHELGARGEGVPAYVVMGYPSASRGPGFLGAKHSFIYLTDTEAGPAGLKRPDFITEKRQDRRQQLLAKLRAEYAKKHADDQKIRDYVETSIAAGKLAGPDFLNVFNLKSESKKLRDKFGGEFGQRCLLARRLVESGVRFVEVSFNLNFINGTGWDTHNQGQQNQHILIQQLDQAFAALIEDLEARDRLDKTLVVIATEFGRPPEFDGGGGRGHQSKAFTIVLAGGGLKTGQAIGATDELAKKIIDRPVSVPDLHATIYHAVGIDPVKELSDGQRPVPITDHGSPIVELF